jgi:bifunctional DNA-binding transcriptional regulator/antitoxin component of YhaV-PrlF toxin-antitoxin module
VGMMLAKERAVSAPAEASVGYAHLDDKGRLPLGKPVRQALGLHAGSTVAYIKVGDALLLIPLDAHLAHLLEAATAAFERAGISVDEMLAELPHVREEIGTAHYGAEFWDELRRSAQEKNAQVGTS